jgi:uncharacterized membrane protein YhaH (DUF805 family)
MSLPREQAWFAAKRYGYGWGLPLRWQGWLVMLAYIAVILTAGFTLAHQHLAAFIAFAVLVSAAFVGICYWKGEPAKWRWGNPDDRKNA